LNVKVVSSKINGKSVKLGMEKRIVLNYSFIEKLIRELDE
jgi:hypothetical protein